MVGLRIAKVDHFEKSIPPGLEMSSHARGVPEILIVRPGALGDTILSLPVLESIRLQNPTAKITFLGGRSYGVLFPKWVEFHAIDDPKWLWLFAGNGTDNLGCERSFDKAYIVLNHPKDVTRNLTRAGVRTVFHTPSRPVPGEHVVERMHRGLGLKIPIKTPALSHCASNREALVWIHPGSGGPKKCVPLDFLMCFVNELGNLKGWSRVVTIGEEDAFLRNDAGWKTLISAPRTRLFEHKPLIELCAGLGSAGLFIGNDSGIAHLAASLGVPSIVFFVSTDPSQWSPWVPPDRVRVIDLRGEVLAAVDAQKLASQVSDLLDG